jgi:hypothetical protein
MQKFKYIYMYIYVYTWRFIHWTYETFSCCSYLGKQKKDYKEI